MQFIVCGLKNKIMEFTLKELEIIKDALTDALMVSDLLDNPSDIIRILDRIDDELNLD